MAGRLSRGVVCLCQFPSPDKTRPVLVLTRTSALSFLSGVSVAPITSTVRGSPTEVALGPEDGMKGACAVNLDRVVTVRRSALLRTVARLSPERLDEVCRALALALGCDDSLA